jgi:hypothetical protein
LAIFNGQPLYFGQIVSKRPNGNPGKRAFENYFLDLILNEFIEILTSQLAENSNLKFEY